MPEWLCVGKFFHEHSHQDIDFTMNINTSALMHIPLEFIQDMQDKGEGHIVNIASAAGMVANPKMSIYCASKWSFIGCSNSLRHEMDRMHKKIEVTTVTPYYISTGMFEGIKSRLIPIIKPEIAVRKIVRAVIINKIFVRMPEIIYWLPLIKGILPARWFDIIVGKWFGVYKSMDEIKGHKNS